MEAITSQIRDLFTKADEEGRKKLKTGLNNLYQELETDWEIIMDLGTTVDSPHHMKIHELTSMQYAKLSIAKVGMDLQLFKMLQESDTPLGTAALVNKTGASPRLLGMKIDIFPIHS